MGNPFSYQDKRVVVTGGASGIGAALLELLGDLGAPHVTVIDRKPPAAAVDRFVEADLSSRVGVDAAAAAIEGPVDVLFNNAGVAGTQPAPVVFSVNYLAVRRLSERLAGRIPAGGAVVITSSMAGIGWQAHQDELGRLMAIDDWDEALTWLDTHPERACDPYALSKECTQLYTLRAARAASRAGTRINSACPGATSTPLLGDFRLTMTGEIIDWSVRQGLGRPASPREVAQILAFLGSDAAGYLNGVNLPVDAGLQAALATGQTD
ncbi:MULTISPECIES: coniferyl-alcohol dehydrogenase [unclassified Parafrankia]|uniref:coniferyl-alcohol dehydrogenase n=1 Tax=unclassified Parafrankia TaxID=2994368 RepID=UPI000DA565F5|nr:MULTISPECIES: coniferyl-alcohol dehydrogenase [unclassified Parafrankia]TCJ32604.1 SDR family oxidoreductase [Parafrankia sp. BMG5.11]SQD99153.1 Short-chain dehydrogenase/reductase SDR [Parafrankia sp. Ea1.12]